MNWQRRVWLLPLLVTVLFCGSCAKKTPTLNLLVWEGYADPSFIKTFEDENHCKVSASYMGSSDELVAKLRGGSAGNYDVISPSSDVATSIATSGLAAALDLSKIPSYGQLSPQLTSLPLVRMNGQVYGVPFMWGPDPIIYDTTAFAQPPDSWTVLWDPKYKGKVSVWDDLSTVYMAAQVLGYDKPDPAHLYNLSDQELEAVKKKLLELKPNVRKMWATGGELTNLFESHEIVIAMGWPLNTADLKKAGFPVGETIPKENTTGWIDHVPPPGCTPDGYSAGPADTGLNYTFNFDRLGVRVPAVLISPWVPKGLVVDASRVFEHASIPTTVTKQFIGNYPQATPREQAAQTFLDLLSLPAIRTDSLYFNV